MRSLKYISSIGCGECGAMVLSLARCKASASPTERRLAFAESALRFHPSVRARRSLFRSPHTSPAKCLRIPRSRLRTVHWTVQSGFAGPSLTPTHGAGQRVQGIRATDRAKPCLRGAGASLPPLGSGAAVQI